MDRADDVPAAEGVDLPDRGRRGRGPRRAARRPSGCPCRVCPWGRRRRPSWTAARRSAGPGTGAAPRRRSGRARAARPPGPWRRRWCRRAARPSGPAGPWRCARRSAWPRTSRAPGRRRPRGRTRPEAGERHLDQEQRGEHADAQQQRGGQRAGPLVVASGDEGAQLEDEQPAEHPGQEEQPADDGDGGQPVVPLPADVVGGQRVLDDELRFRAEGLDERLAARGRASGRRGPGRTPRRDWAGTASSGRA